ncbi:MAG: glycoside hydrolase [Rhizobiaceae bacterium]|jgi:photosystem II stability/assembly factor-like uncharacterized protein|nr:glycoside hydrolase [Rhizobiaceae bacterium]
MGDGVTVLAGTTKGAFLISPNIGRDGWTVSGPHCGGWPINHVIADPDSGTLYAGGGGDWHGAGVWRSHDGGATWALAKLSRGKMDHWAANDPDFAAMIGWSDPDTRFDGAADAVWSLAHDGAGTLYAGCKPGMLYASADGGVTWSSVDGFNAHPDRAGWNPGAAGLTLHTIVPDRAQPGKLWLGVSAAGVFATDDGGRTWETRNRLANGEACAHHDHPAAPRDGMTGLCVHNMVRAGGETLYQQNHHGVFRSQDGGRSWHDITDGLPSTFGFPIAVDPHDPQTLYVFPLNGDSDGRFPPGASAAVWRSRDGGTNWQAMREGLPQAACFFTVLRQAMATDTRATAGVYIGTNSGSVFASFDQGEAWHEIARHLPTVLSVETWSR